MAWMGQNANIKDGVLTYLKVMRKLDEWWSSKKPDTDTENGSSRGHKVPKVKKVESKKWRRILLHQMFIRAVHGNSGGIETHSRVSYSSTCLPIVNEVNKMRNKGIDLLKYMKIQNLTVADKMTHNDTAFSLHRQPRDGVEMEQFRALSIVIEGVLLHDMVDRWKWTLEGLGEFSVASARKFIDNSRRGPEFTWEREDSFKKKYPHLFINRTSSSTTRS
nr:hypothetical protein [Tanacetum cinerariifolium]